jgi:hypothetical protein
MTPDPLTAIVDELGACHDQLTQLDHREAGHYTALTAQLTALTAHPAPASAQEPGGYQPGPPPRWWNLAPDARQEPIAWLRAWVEQVYQPGYGHLAATLGPCWPSHDLCLYALDIAASLWSLLYLQPGRSPGTLTAQAEYQARILPALAGQLSLETTRCGHARTAPVPGRPRSAP